jgi:chromosome segregation ATPase
MSEWRAVRDRIQVDAGVPFPRDTAAAAIEIDRFLDRRLRHHQAASEDLLSRADVADETKALFRIYSGACENVEVEPAKVESIRAELEKIDSIVGPLVADLKSRARSLAKEVAELHQARAAEIERSNSLVEEHDRLEAEVEAKRAEAVDLATRIAAVEAERDGLVALAEGKSTQVAGLTSRVSLVEAERDGMAAIAEESRLEAARVAERLEALRELYDSEQARVASMSAECVVLEQRLQTAEAELSRTGLDFEQERLEIGRKVDELNRALNIAQDRCREHDERWLEHFGETAILSRMLLEREQQAFKETEKAQRLRELYHALMGRPLWWAILPRSHQTRMEHRRLRRLGLFDAQGYLSKNPDVAQSGMDPFRHYLIHGIDENRQV